MSIWARIVDALGALANGEGLGDVFDRLTTPPERSVAFTIAVIALAAKMAKADGRVTRNEVATFRALFTIPPDEEGNAARVFNLARQDVAGFDSYARKIATMFGPGNRMLTDVTEGLFMIALADGEYHPAEDMFLREVAQIFGLDARTFRSLQARFVPNAAPDPYEVLGVDPDAPLSEVRAAWRQAVLESHPDGMQSRGIPPEAIRMAEDRLVAVNRAWEEISRREAA